jgi:hypothetical protein
MRPQPLNLKEVDYLPGEEVAFKIGDPRMIMYSLSDLYSDIVKAVIREYSTNARDSHILAGKENVPIHVTLPTSFHPFFDVEDFGVGMSEDDLRNVWTTFGDSTKREDDRQNGMFGFGSKAAVAYTDQFTITATKDGWTIIGVVSKRSDYSITLKIVSKKATDKPNGVKITVPVENHMEFAQKAKDFYRFWHPGTVLVDGQEPKRAVGEKIDDNLYYSTTPGDSYIVMGDVGYKINNPDVLFRTRGINSISFVAYVPMGAVEFSKSREDLKYSDLTKNTLENLITDFEEKMKIQSKKEIAEASNYYEAWKAWRKWSGKLGRNSYYEMSFEGKKLIDVFGVVGFQYDINGSRRQNMWSVGQWSIEQVASSLFVMEFDMQPSTHHKTKVRDYIQHAGLNVNEVLFTKEKKLSVDWVPANRVITWEKLKEVTPKRQRPAKAPSVPGFGRVSGSWDYYDRKMLHTEKSVPNVSNLYYIETEDKKRLNGYAARDILDLINDDGVVVIMPANRKDKFLRENPKAKNFIDYMNSYITWDGEKLLSETGKEVLNLSEDTLRWLERLKGYKIDDPKFNRLQRLSEKKEDYLTEYNLHFRLAKLIGKGYSFTYHRPLNSIHSQKLFEDYPLLRSLPQYNVKHLTDDIVLYLNAAYAAKRKEVNRERN